MSGRYAACVGDEAVRDVRVRPLGDDRFAVAIDGDESIWHGQALAAGEWLLRDEATGRTHAVALEAAEDGHRVHGDGLAVDVSLRSPRQERMRARRAAVAAPVAAGEVRATMPGRVVAVLVAVGEGVAEGAPLAVVEAMKMENELRAPWDAEVVALSVAAGDVVVGGAPVCTLRRRPPLGSPGGQHALA